MSDKRVDALRRAEHRLRAEGGRLPELCESAQGEEVDPSTARPL